MPRVARIYTEEGVFHVLSRGNNRQIIFHDEDDFKAYKAKIELLKEEQPFKLYHYCLMSNHIHLIIETNVNTELSKLMKRLNLSYYNYYKKKYSYTGHFWQGRFKSLLIDKDNYLLACGLYVEKNPFRAKMVKKVQDYPYSSYNYYAYGKKDNLIDEDLNYGSLGKEAKARQQEYRRLMVDKKDNLNSNMFNRLYLGSEEFIRKMEERFGVKNIRPRRGRPKSGK